MSLSETTEKTAVRKIAINRCYGGFGLSDAAFIEFMRRKGHTIYAQPQVLGSDYFRTPIDQLPAILTKPFYKAYNAGEGEAYEKASEAAGKVYAGDFINMKMRDDPDLIAVIEEFGDAAANRFSKPEIVEIPADVHWEIEEYDGQEWVAEAHRTW